MLPHIPLPAHFSAPLKSKIPWVVRTFCLQLFSLILTYSSHVLLHYSTEIVVVISNHHSVNQRSNLSPHLVDLSAAFDTGDHSIFHDTYSSFDIQNSDFVLFPTFSRSCYSQPPFFFFAPHNLLTSDSRLSQELWSFYPSLYPLFIPKWGYPVSEI